MKKHLFFLAILLVIGNTYAQFTTYNWLQKGSTINGEAVEDRFGVSVSMSSDGQTIAIGSNLNDGNGSNSGSVRIYTWNGNSWIQKGADLDGEVAGDQSGYDVSINSDGNVILIGAYYNDGAGTNAGHARVYVWNGTSWQQRGADINPSGASEYSGFAVDIDSLGNNVIIGAWGYSSQAGAARIYNWNGTNYVMKGSAIVSSNPSEKLGKAVTINSTGSRVAVGMEGYNSYAGAVKVFEFSAGNWTQLGSLLDLESNEQFFGRSLELNSDGNYMVVGAGADMSGVGSVRVFHWDGVNWGLSGNVLLGNGSTETFGGDVAINSSGNVIAVSSPSNYDLSTQNGKVTIYKLVNNTWEIVGIPVYGSPSSKFGTSVDLDASGNSFIGGGPSISNTETGLAKMYSVCTNTFSNEVITACESYTWINGNTYSQDDSSSFHIIPNANGCDSIIHLYLTILSNNSGIHEVTNCGSYTWLNGVNYSQSNNTDTIHLVNSLGCDSIVTLNLTINPLPYIELIVSENTISVADTSLSYYWGNCATMELIPGAENYTFTATETGSYGVFVVGENGCSDTSECVDVIFENINKIYSSTKSIQPIVFEKEILVKNSNPYEVTHIEVFNSLGQNLYSTFVMSNTTIIDTRNWDKGVYLLIAQQGNRTDFFKLFVR